jgi:hypothetical protein
VAAPRARAHRSFIKIYRHMHGIGIKKKKKDKKENTIVLL